jgi:hypothetical protein
MPDRLIRRSGVLREPNSGDCREWDAVIMRESRAGAASLRVTFGSPSGDEF